MLTKQQINDKVYNNSLHTCEYISGYENRNSIIKVKCLIHNLDFETRYENVARDNRAHHICPQCQIEDKQSDKVDVECSYCHKVFKKALSDLGKSRSGLYFCCREHKDLAQRLDSGDQFKNIRPSHYGKDNIMDYRKAAFENYEHKCHLCNWQDDEDILEVHHINENHNDNRIENLMILCPICHRKLTSHKYKIENNALILN